MYVTNKIWFDLIWFDLLDSTSHQVSHISPVSPVYLYLRFLSVCCQFVLSRQVVPVCFYMFFLLSSLCSSLPSSDLFLLALTLSLPAVLRLPDSYYYYWSPPVLVLPFAYPMYIINLWDSNHLPPVCIWVSSCVVNILWYRGRLRPTWAKARENATLQI